MTSLPTLILENKIERTSNFNQKEVEILEKLIFNYQRILLSKRTDAVSCRQKEDVWEKIHKDFNAAGDTPRSIKQLKNKWDNLKRNVKKQASIGHQLNLKLEDVPPLTPSPPPAVDPSEMLETIMSVAEEEHEASDDEEEIEQKHTIVQSVLNSSTPHASLKRPAPSQLRRALRKNKLQNREIKESLIKKKNLILTDFHNLERRYNTSVRQQEQLHQQMLDHNEEIHQLEKRKYLYNEEILKLDIAKRKNELEILKAQLQKLRSDTK